MKWYEGLLTVTVALLVYRWLRGAAAGDGRRPGRPDEAGFAEGGEYALEALERASEAEPGNATFHAWRGRALLELGRHADALAAFERACSLSPRNPSHPCGRGEALLELGRHADALAAFERARSLDPVAPEPHAQMARALRLLGRHDEAAAALGRAAELALSGKAPA
ncbi:MAG: tetratricopeptide repeat protein [Thaumarchaeota archaeon]|nr:tetratricopeptide repeat protein [Nitrososphaerota archaeon]